MIVVKVYMWPQGDETQARLLSQATIDFQFEAKADDEALGVRKGERAYRVTLLKDTQFGGPKDGDEIRPVLVDSGKVWRNGRVRGHMPKATGADARGVWDLIGGALKVLLGNRLERYRDARS